MIITIGLLKKYNRKTKQVGEEKTIWDEEIGEVDVNDLMDFVNFVSNCFRRRRTII